MGKVFAIANQKGGVGKTTTAVNLSACLAEKGQRVLLIDTDPQGNATSGLGIDKKKVLHSIYSVFFEDRPVENLIVNTGLESLKLIPSNIDLIGAEVELVDAADRDMRLKNALEDIKADFNFVIIDVPPSLGLLTVNALVAADGVIIPMQCEYYALEGISQLLNIISLIKNGSNPSLDISGVLLTMADSRTNLTGEVIKEARDFFKEKTYSTVIPRSVRLSESPGFGKPIILYDDNSAGAAAYRAFADEVLKNE